MYKALKRREEERQSAIQIATEYIRRLERDIGVSTGVLFGSFARGDFNAGSDIDVLIISDSLPSDILKRMDLLYQRVQGRIEPKGYTKSEFLKMLCSKNPIAMDALKNGNLLYDDGFWHSIKCSEGVTSP